MCLRCFEKALKGDFLCATRRKYYNTHGLSNYQNKNEAANFGAQTK